MTGQVGKAVVMTGAIFNATQTEIKPPIVYRKGSMKSSKIFIQLLLTMPLLITSFFAHSAETFSQSGATAYEGPVGYFDRLGHTDKVPGLSQAPTGFDNLTNGYDKQGPGYETLNAANAVPLRSFNENRFLFEQVETVADGLGPTYNGQACRECHQNIVTGGASQVEEKHAGHLTQGVYFDSLGGSLIQARATNPEIVEQLTAQDTIAPLVFQRIPWEADMSNASPIPRSWLFATDNPLKCGAWRSWYKSWKITAVSASDASAGRANTPAWNRFPPMLIVTRWALRIRCSLMKTQPTDVLWVLARALIRFPILKMTASM